MPKARAKEQGGREIFTPNQPFTANYDGADVSFVPGDDLIREGHELLKLYPELFEPVRIRYDVEQATAAPGEKRKR